ncbi:paraquat-inducible membrane protein A [Gammaproteobacteria bacterium 45_16_T64]|nr:paraquat-inducible membrane protein A [Gammaproteobacteria bacterium 45_16_T64]
MQFQRALTQGLTACDECHHVVRLTEVSPTQSQRCSRCFSVIHARKPKSISRTWAWVLTGLILLFPANMLPVMTVVYLGNGSPDTIMSGVIHLAEEGMYPIALLVFIASVFVPIVKLVGLITLLVVVQCKLPLSAKQCTYLYRMIEFIGRWSMLDLFMISILVTLVDLGAVASITAGAGATAFASVVVATIFAANTFDPRLIWDLRAPVYDH